MAHKKCIICGKEAAYCIKGTSDCYCEDCAKEFFGDLDLLEKIDQAEKQAKQLKQILNSNISQNTDDKIDDNDQDLIEK